MAPHCFQDKIQTPVAVSQIHSYYTQICNNISLFYFLELSDLAHNAPTLLGNRSGGTKSILVKSVGSKNLF